MNIVRPCGSAWTECGYCKGSRAHFSSAGDNRRKRNENSNDQQSSSSVGGKKTPSEDKAASSHAYTMLLRDMAPAMYEEGFVWSGWRRSGVALYRPHNEKSCCPLYTIRLRVANFQITQSQRKLLRKTRNILRGGTKNVPGNSQPVSTSVTSQIMLELEQSVLESTLIQKLLTPWIRQGIFDELSRLVANDGNDESSNAIDEIAQWVESMPSLFKVRRQHQQKSTHNTKKRPKPDQPGDLEKLAGDPLSTMSLTLTTPVCASVAGRSKDIFTDASCMSSFRARLAQAAAKSAWDHYQQEKMASSSLLTRPITGTNVLRAVSIQSITVHEPSGHIVVQLRASMNAISKQETETRPIVANDDDKISLWWKKEQESHRQLAPTCCDYYNPITQLNMSAPAATSAVAAEVPERIDSIDGPYRMDVTTIPAHESALDPTVHQLYFRYQHHVHDDPDPFAVCDCSKSAKSLEKRADSETSNVDADETKQGDEDVEMDEPKDDWGDRSPAGWRLKANQMLQGTYSHLPDKVMRRVVCAYGDFYNFLVESPFPLENLSASRASNVGLTGSSRRLPPRPGTYHQQYRLRPSGLLVAVGVVDVLPTGLSSVYLFYDPKFARELIPMGKYAILKEIEWTQQHDLPFYYLGYYIESCRKMSYKAEYRPSELLCPVTHQWVDADTAKSIIRRNSPHRHYCRLYHQTGEDTGDSKTDNEVYSPCGQVTDRMLNRIPLDVGIDQAVTLDMLQEHGKALVRPIIEEFLKETGEQVATRCTISFR